jgi:hypothetical protein
MYLIVLSPAKDELLELIPSEVFSQKHYPKKQLKIIGMTTRKRHALELVQEIITEIYEKTGTLQVKEYFTDAVFVA